MPRKPRRPHEILEQTSPVTFRLKLPATVNIHPIFHAGLLKAHVGGATSKPLPIPDKESDEYEIEKILGYRRKKDGKCVYLVKWKGYSYEESTWEPASHFKSQTLQAYHRARKEERAEQSDSSSEDDDEPATSLPKTQRGRRQKAASLNSLIPTHTTEQNTVTARARADTACMHANECTAVPFGNTAVTGTGLVRQMTLGYRDKITPTHKHGHLQPGSVYKESRFLG